LVAFRDRVRGGAVAELPHREAEDVAVENVVGVVGQVGREPRCAQPAQQPLHVAQPRLSGAARLRRSDGEAARPGVAEVGLVGRERARPDLRAFNLRRKLNAIVYERYGGPEVLELRELDVPEVPEDGLLVRVKGSSVNPVDWHMMTGTPFVVRLVAGLRRPKD